jgi:hypothetical protein
MGQQLLGSELAADRGEHRQAAGAVAEGLKLS